MIIIKSNKFVDPDKQKILTLLNLKIPFYIQGAVNGILDMRYSCCGF